MTDDATRRQPLDFRDRCERDALAAAWDAWLQDDRSPAEHPASASLTPGLAAAVEALYAADNSPSASSSFRADLRSELLSRHAAQRIEPPSAGSSARRVSATAEHRSVQAFPTPHGTGFGARRSRGRLLAAVAAACLLVALAGAFAYDLGRRADTDRRFDLAQLAAQPHTPTPTPTPIEAGSAYAGDAMGGAALGGTVLGAESEAYGGEALDDFGPGGGAIGWEAPFIIDETPPADTSSDATSGGVSIGAEGSDDDVAPPTAPANIQSSGDTAAPNPGPGVDAASGSITVSEPLRGALALDWVSRDHANAQQGQTPVSVVAAEGLVAVLSMDSAQRTVLLSVYDTDAGARRWSGDVSDGISPTGTATTLNPAPVISGETVYVVNRAGILFVVHAGDADDPSDVVVDRHQLPVAAVSSQIAMLGSELYVVGGDTQVQASMAIADRDLFVVNVPGSKLLRIDARTGTVLGSTALPANEDGDEFPALYRCDSTAMSCIDRWDQPETVPTHLAGLDDGLLAITYSSESGGLLGVTTRRASDLRDMGTFSAEAVAGNAVAVGRTAVVPMSDTTGLSWFAAIGLDRVETLGVPWTTADALARPIVVGGDDATIALGRGDTLLLFVHATGEAAGGGTIGAGIGDIAAFAVESGAVYVAFTDGAVARFVPEFTGGR